MTEKNLGYALSRFIYLGHGSQGILPTMYTSLLPRHHPYNYRLANSQLKYLHTIPGASTEMRESSIVQLDIIGIALCKAE